jgi:hypothetical protein
MQLKFQEESVSSSRQRVRVSLLGHILKKRPTIAQGSISPPMTEIPVTHFVRASGMATQVYE